MTQEEAYSLSKTAGIELQLKPFNVPDEAHLLYEEAPLTEKEIRKHKIKGRGNVITDPQVLILPYVMTPKEARAVAAKIAKHPDVESAGPSVWGYDDQVPTDVLYKTSQWNLKTSAGGANLPPAWDITTGSGKVVVAVLDGGILANHVDLIGRTVSGYDFITDPVIANDGGGRDTDPTDPGNWVTQADVIANPNSLGKCTFDPSQTKKDSTWHGTHVAGIIGAISNNSIGVAGVNWVSKLLPVRISGKCAQGNSLDVSAAIQWAAGIPSVTPLTNINPAKVINISFGGMAVCPSEIQAAINAVVKKNVVVVVAAGNNSDIVSAFWPANCANVITVTSVTREGGLSPFSNTGSAVALSAAGGDDTGYAIDAITSTGDGGTTAALNDNAYINMIGTSQAAPVVSGVASLMLSVNNKLNFKQVKSMLQKTARSFPKSVLLNCTTTLCGAGIVDGAAAVRAAQSRVGAGDYHSIALKSDGSVWSWGYNGNGQLGDGTALTTLRTSPGPLAALSAGVTDIAGGEFHNTAVKSDGTAWAWGYNATGQLGNNTSVDQSTPVQVSGLAGVITTVVGSEHSLALKSDGTVWDWGYNFFGQLGDGTYVDKHIPVQVSGLTAVVAIAAGGKRSLALKNDGTVWAWGKDAHIISATTASISTIPLQVPGLVDVIAIAAAGDAATGVNVDTSLALKSDGTVWAWGFDNSFGQLGDGTLVGKFTPVQVSGLTEVVSIAAGNGYFSTAVKSDGTVWTWGNGNAGQLGNGSSGTLIYSTTPVQSSNVSNAVSISAGASHLLTLDGDLTIQAWGANDGGQLGTGTTLPAVFAVQTVGQGGVGTFNTANTTTGKADLLVTLNQSPLPASVGIPLSYAITVTNQGSGIATNVMVTLALPGSTQVISSSSGCTAGTGVVTCVLGTMASGAATGLQVTISPLAAGNLNSTAYVSADSIDQNSTNNSAGVSTTVNADIVDSEIPALPQWGLMVMGGLLLLGLAWKESTQRLEIA
ncbi:MAG: S8 family serine peptidase [Gammaproteobacteria bacterium]|nr:S8 family serine peptidase [Gammaproteobacteria bacterium]